MEIKNLTPHPVTLVAEDGTILSTLHPVGLARLSQSIEPAEPISTQIFQFPTSVSVFGEATGLPEPEGGVYFVVSQMIKSALPWREDLLVPAEVVRDTAGKILGCQSLGR